MSDHPVSARLRDGRTVADPRLDLIPRWDPRNREYPLRATLTAEDIEQPRSYTWGCDVWLDQGAYGACFPAGTLVRMADGSHRPIETLRVLDEVATAEGRTGRVLQTMVRPANAVVRLWLWGHSHLRCTPEHPVRARRLGGSRRRPSYTEGYVPAAELRAGDWVALPRFLPEREHVVDAEAVAPARAVGGVIDGTVNTGGVLSEVAPIPSLIGLTPSFGRLIGLYAAEGCTTAGKVVWTFGRHEAGLVEETVALVKAVFDARARVQHRPNNATNVVLYGQRWRLLFERLVPGTARRGDKRLSAHITAGPASFLRAVLRGWQDGDGYRRRTSVQTVTVSRHLAMDMHAVAVALGDMPALTWSKAVLNAHAATRQDRWDLTIGQGEPTYRAEQDDGTLWRKVRSVEAESFDGWVFNLHVQGDESYIAEGIGVHNCVGHAAAHDVYARPAAHAQVGPDHPNPLAFELYWEGQRRDVWPGGEYPGAQPFEGGTDLNSVASVAVEMGFMAEYRWAANPDELAVWVSRKGPANLACPWYEGMMALGDDGYVRPVGEVQGWHAILVRSYSVTLRRFGLHQSWGNAADGLWWVSEEDMAALWDEGAHAYAAVGRRLRVPIPVEAT